MHTPQRYLSQTINGLLSTSKHTRGELADALGMQRRALYQRLSDRQSWNLDELEKTARFFGYPDVFSLFALAESQQETDMRTFKKRQTLTA